MHCAPWHPAFMVSRCAFLRSLCCAQARLVHQIHSPTLLSLLTAARIATQTGGAETSVWLPATSLRCAGPWRHPGPQRMGHCHRDRAAGEKVLPPLSRLRAFHCDQGRPSSSPPPLARTAAARLALKIHTPTPWRCCYHCCCRQPTLPPQ